MRPFFEFLQMLGNVLSTKDQDFACTHEVGLFGFVIWKLMGSFCSEDDPSSVQNVGPVDRKSVV